MSSEELYFSKEIFSQTKKIVLVCWFGVGFLTTLLFRLTQSTLITTFGSQVPNIASESTQIIVETYSIWMLYIAPVLLKGHFLNQCYYKHFKELVQLLTLCLEVEITQDKVNDLEIGFPNWVKGYELYVLAFFFSRTVPYD